MLKYEGDGRVPEWSNGEVCKTFDSRVQIPSRPLMDRSSELKVQKTRDQTEVTEKIKRISSQIEGEGAEYIVNTARYIQKNFTRKLGSTEPNFRRSAEEIIDSQYWDGCNEAGVVIAALLRAKGFQLTYIQAINIRSLESYSASSPNLSGHVFLRVEVDDKWVFVNSTTGEIVNNLPKEMIVGREGKDSWDIGLREGWEDLRNLFEEKREEMF